MEAQELKVAFGDQEAELAQTIYRKHMQLDPCEVLLFSDALVRRVSEEAERSLDSLSKTEALPKMITGPESNQVLAKVVQDLEPGDLGLLWCEYEVPPIISGWLAAFLGMAQERSSS